MTSLSGAPCWRTSRQHSGACDSAGPSGTLGPRPEEFYSLFPFHFVMDRCFRLLQAGAGMRKVLPEMVPGTQVNELLTVRSACTIGALKMGNDTVLAKPIGYSAQLCLCLCCCCFVTTSPSLALTFGH